MTSKGNRLLGGTFFRHRRASLAILALALLTMISASIEAATLRYRIECPKSNTWHTASTYGANQLMANTVFSGWSFSNQGYSVSMSRQDVSATRCVYTIWVYNVPAGRDYFAIIRQNNSGDLRWSGRQFAGSASGTYDLGIVSFY